MNKEIESLKKRIAELEEEVKQLKAKPEYHYHFHSNPMPSYPVFVPYQPYPPKKFHCETDVAAISSYSLTSQASN